MYIHIYIYIYVYRERGREREREREIAPESQQEPHRPLHVPPHEKVLSTRSGLSEMDSSLVLEGSLGWSLDAMNLLYHELVYTMNLFIP